MSANDNLPKWIQTGSDWIRLKPLTESLGILSLTFRHAAVTHWYWQAWRDSRYERVRRDRGHAGLAPAFAPVRAVKWFSIGPARVARGQPAKR